MSDAAMIVAGAIACLGLAGAGSAFGTGFAAAAAVGAWKKCYAANKPAPSGEESDPEIIYRECDENGIPLDGHYMLCYNNEEDDCEACKIGTSGLFHGAQGDE